MDSFPVFFRMDDAVVAVLGGGETARRKVRLLARTPAIIRVYSDAPDDAFRDEFGERVNWRSSSTLEGLEQSRFLIIAETDPTLAMAAFKAARASNVPVNWVDRKAWCDFTVPSLLSRGPVVAAIATGGAAPVLARDLRSQLDALLPPTISGLAEMARSLRAAVRIHFNTETERRRFWEGFFQGPVAESMLAGDQSAALEHLSDLFASRIDPSSSHPVVFLQPPEGGADGITLRAYRLLQVAEWLGHAPGTDPALLDMVRRDANRSIINDSAEPIIDAARTGARCVVIAPSAQRSHLQLALDAAGLTSVEDR